MILVGVPNLNVGQIAGGTESICLSSSFISCHRPHRHRHHRHRHQHCHHGHHFHHRHQLHFEHTHDSSIIYTKEEKLYWAGGWVSMAGANQFTITTTARVLMAAPVLFVCFSISLFQSQC